jgi:hypothetical protein
MRKRISVTILVLALLVLAAYFLTHSLTDIRTEEMLQERVTTATMEKGRAILAAAMEAHGGLERWKQYQMAEVTMTDEWPNLLFRAMMMPWEQNKQLMKAHYLLGADVSRVEFLDGPNKEEIWGIQNWATYKQKPGEQVRFAEDGDIKFYLPTAEYFFELPFRVPFAGIVSHAGERSLDGTQYDLVFASWNSAEPQEKLDQYIIWVNKQTKLIDFVRYTVREKGGFMSAFRQFEDYRTVQGIQVPFVQRSIMNREPSGSMVLQETVLREVKFGVDVPESFFYPDPSVRSTKF